MHRARIVFRHPVVSNGVMHSKRLVADLHDWGFTCDEAVEILCMIFGLSPGAANLFIVTHPAWVADNTV